MLHLGEGSCLTGVHACSSVEGAELKHGDTELQRKLLLSQKRLPFGFCAVPKMRMRAKASGADTMMTWCVLIVKYPCASNAKINGGKDRIIKCQWLSHLWVRMNFSAMSKACSDCESQLGREVAIPNSSIPSVYSVAPAEGEPPEQGVEVATPNPFVGERLETPKRHKNSEYVEQKATGFHVSDPLGPNEENSTYCEMWRGIWEKKHECI